MKKRVVSISLLWTAFLILILGIFLFLQKTNLGVPCLFHLATNLYCPGCGMTRAIQSILQFDFQMAFQQNALIYLFGPLLLIYFLINSYRYIKKQPLWKVSNRVIFTLLVITILFSVIRNLPGFEFLHP